MENSHGRTFQNHRGIGGCPKKTSTLVSCYQSKYQIGAINQKKMQ